MNVKKYTCLQLTTTSVRVVTLRFHHGSWGASLSGEKQLPETLEGADVFHHPALAQTIRGLCTDVSLRSKKVLLSIPGDGVLLKRIQTPGWSGATSEQRNAAIEADIGNHISVPLDQAAYDWAMTGQTENTTHWLIAWMRKPPLELLLSGLKEIGIEPVYVMPSSLVLANQLVFNADCSQRICGLHIDGNLIDLVVMEEGGVMGGRTFSIGDPPNPTALWRAMKQSLAGTSNPNQTDLKQVVVFQTAESLLTPEDIKRELSVSRCEVRESGTDWAQALLRGYLRNEGIFLNLLTPILHQKADARKQMRKQQVNRLIPLATIICLVVANLGIWNTIEATRSRMEGLYNANASAKLQERGMKSLQKSRETLESQIAEVAWGERRFPSFVDRFRAIAESIPKQVRLTEIKTLEPPRTREVRVNYDARKTLLLVGLAPSQQEIDAFRAALSTRKEFDAVRQVKTEQTTIQGEKWLNFTLSVVSRVETNGEGG